jgi:hypothetical protein
MINPLSDLLAMVISPWTNHLPIALSSFFSPGWSFAIVSAYLFFSLTLSIARFLSFYCSNPILQTLFLNYSLPLLLYCSLGIA